MLAWRPFLVMGPLFAQLIGCTSQPRAPAGRLRFLVTEGFPLKIDVA